MYYVLYTTGDHPLYASALSEYLEERPDVMEGIVAYDPSLLAPMLAAAHSSVVGGAGAIESEFEKVHHSLLNKMGSRVLSKYLTSAPDILTNMLIMNPANMELAAKTVKTYMKKEKLGQAKKMREKAATAKQAKEKGKGAGKGKGKEPAGANSGGDDPDEAFSGMSDQQLLAVMDESLTVIDMVLEESPELLSNKIFVEWADKHEIAGGGGGGSGGGGGGGGSGGGSSGIGSGGGGNGGNGGSSSSSGVAALPSVDAAILRCESDKYSGGMTKSDKVTTGEIYASFALTQMLEKRQWYEKQWMELGGDVIHHRFHIPLGGARGEKDLLLEQEKSRCKILTQQMAGMEEELGRLQRLMEESEIDFAVPQVVKVGEKEEDAVHIDTGIDTGTGTDLAGAGAGAEGGEGTGAGAGTNGNVQGQGQDLPVHMQQLGTARMPLTIPEFW
jgi:hypothetical protein